MNMRAVAVIMVTAVTAALLYDLNILRSYDHVRSFNSGVACYRKGEFKAALDNFVMSAGGSDMRLKYRAVYNQGNCLARMAEQSTDSDSAAAERFYLAALDRYREVLRYSPGDLDTIANLSAVSAARGALTAGRDRQMGGRKEMPKLPQAGKRDDSDKETPAKQKPENGRQTESAGKSGQPADQGNGEDGRRRKTMGREEAERLLDEKRGQETLPSGIKAAPGGVELPSPAKNW